MSGEIHFQSKIGNVLILITKGRGYAGLPLEGTGLPRLPTPTRSLNLLDMDTENY